jgi:hypothetical protein
MEKERVSKWIRKKVNQFSDHVSAKKMATIVSAPWWTNNQNWTHFSRDPLGFIVKLQGQVGQKMQRFS